MQTNYQIIGDTVKTMEMDRYKYREHRNELALILGIKIGETMEEHMNGSESN